MAAKDLKFLTAALFLQLWRVNLAGLEFQRWGRCWGTEACSSLTEFPWCCAPLSPSPTLLSGLVLKAPQALFFVPGILNLHKPTSLLRAHMLRCWVGVLDVVTHFFLLYYRCVDILLFIIFSLSSVCSSCDLKLSLLEPFSGFFIIFSLPIFPAFLCAGSTFLRLPWLSSFITYFKNNNVLLFHDAKPSLITLRQSILYESYFLFFLFALPVFLAREYWACLSWPVSLSEFSSRIWWVQAGSFIYLLIYFCLDSNLFIVNLWKIQ